MVFEHGTRIEENQRSAFIFFFWEGVCGTVNMKGKKQSSKRSKKSYQFDDTSIVKLYIYMYNEYSLRNIKMC